ncbi:MAG TPA: NAD(P)H-binding protein, partial [Longimicrobiales bacterium]|nr:NAD(P)H-binding protein [Longimicrobiales bacterium]
MPVMVVGADTPTGERITQRLLHPPREVRVFVTDSDVAQIWRDRGAKVALGDVSDDTHLTAACHHAFSMVLIEEATRDGREYSFASDPGQVMAGWARAAEQAEVSRVIWVTSSTPPPVQGREVAVVDESSPDLA